MKKSLLLIALAGLMTLAACKKDKESQGEAVFTATIEHQGGRTSLDPNNGNINWTAGDQIVIANDNDETAVFTLQSGEGTTEGGFGTSDEFNTVGPFIAAYPSTALIAGDVVSFNLPATQTIGETGTFANGANSMVACSDDKNLQFKNLCGGVGVRLKGNGVHVSGVRITSKNTAEKLWGTYEVSNCAANEPTLAVAPGNQGSNIITLACDVTLTTAAKTFFVMLPPGTLANGFTMEVMDGDQVLATKETTSDVALVERNSVKVFNEILIGMDFNGNVEVPTGMEASNIIVTNFSEDAIPDEDGNFSIGYSKMLVATNADNNKPIYFTVNSTDFSVQKSVLENGDYELSAKETALYFALNNFPYGLSGASDEKFNALKNLLYSLDCVQQLEQTVSNVVNQYGYLDSIALENSIETVRNYFYNQLIVPIIDNAKENKGISLIPPHADPDHYGQLAKIEFLNEQYNANSDEWDILCRCWNGFAIWVGVTEGILVSDDLVSFQPEFIVDYISPTTATHALSIESYLDWNHFVEGFKDLYGTISEYFNNNQQYFQTAGKSNRDVWFNLNSAEDAICYVGPEFKQVITANCVGLALEGVKFVLGQLIGPSFNADANLSMFVAESEMDEEFIRLIDVWLNTHNKKDFKAAIRRVVHNMGVGLLNHGIFNVEMLAAYNKYTAMYSAFAFAVDLALAMIEYAHFNSFYFEVGGEHVDPSVVSIGVTNITSTSATLFACVKKEGAMPVVERGFDYCDTNAGNISYGTVISDTGGGLGVYSCTVQNLLQNTEYEVFTWVRTEVGGDKKFGEPLMYFTTLPSSQSFTITATANPTNGGTVSGGGAFDQGQSCTLTATANSGYTFTNWTENGNVVSTEASYTFTVNSDRDLVANFTFNGGGTPTDGVLNGLFTINANGDQVNFSQGNLQYQASTNTWRFAEQQYDYVGNDNANISQTYSGWIDLFGWGTSGYNHGAIDYQPWSTNTWDSHYYAYGDWHYNLCDQTGQADWGYNAISNGGNSENSGWRTLTYDEWHHVLYSRNTASGIRCAMATVNNVNGVVLLPDNWDASLYTLSNTNSRYGRFDDNIIYAEDWANVFEANGAVFLSAAGERYMSVGGVGSYGRYWMSTRDDADCGNLVSFENGHLTTYDRRIGDRCFGYSVRLVRLAQ